MASRWTFGGRCPPRCSAGRYAGGAVDAIDVERLNKVYGKVHAVRDLNFIVPEGSIAGFVGPNGSGKTTTIRTLLGLVRATSGSATVLGHSIANPNAYMHRVGALIESPAFYPSVSGTTNLTTLATLGGHDKKRVPELIELVGLKGRERDPVKSYSLGMKQRLGIAAALLADPILLILDEPANGLDPPGIIEMRDLMRRLREQGTTLFVSSHLLGEVEQIADWLIVLKDGEALYCGEATALPGRAGAEIVVETAAADQLAVVARIAQKHGYETVVSGGHARVAAPAEFAGVLNSESMQAGAVIVELHRAKASLEESFLHLISGDN